MATLPRSDLGEVVAVPLPGAICKPALPEWTGSPSGAKQPRKILVDGAERSPAPSASARKARPRRRSRSSSQAANSSRNDSDVGDASGDAGALLEPPRGSGDAGPLVEPPHAADWAAVPHRSTRRTLHLPRGETMTEALTSCIRRKSGLPSSSRVGSGAARGTATVVRDPASGSCAIVLRHGTLKRDAVLWLSALGGLMCSCFGGTKNSQLLSVCGRSTDC